MDDGGEQCSSRNAGDPRHREHRLGVGRCGEGVRLRPMLPMLSRGQVALKGSVTVAKDRAEPAGEVRDGGRLLPLGSLAVIIPIVGLSAYKKRGET
jgi:hypothetical protein